MNTDEIEKLVSKFCLVVSLDQLPQKNSLRDEMFIINTEKINSNEVGHWVLLSKNIINDKSRIIFFDSLGLPPILKNVIVYINNNIGAGGSLTCNKLQIQNENSSSCGKFCVVLASHLNNNLSYESYLHAFRFTPEINEKRIGEVFAEYRKRV